VCSNFSSCTTCVNSYFYTNTLNKCLACSDIFPNCITCIASNPVACQTCDFGYFVNATNGCTSCVANCGSCTDSNSCTTCLTSNYIYSSSSNTCVLCSDIFLNCGTCSNSSGNIQCSICSFQFILNISTNANHSTTCFSYCGD
jgi:hypothetical protein